MGFVTRIQPVVFVACLALLAGLLPYMKGVPNPLYGMPFWHKLFVPVLAIPIAALVVVVVRAQGGSPRWSVLVHGLLAALITTFYWQGVRVDLAIGGWLTLLFGLVQLVLWALPAKAPK